ncbi:hypothetical protein [uncultured Tateyamaria sp.]|uniref:hypothetical protein n=1 Tax=uncultured Tateyamaria sp. TaxID=455651 RepID=UPI0026068C71|nr:hypothetical protein [uncultured Tateyamaria sp.]
MSSLHADPATHGTRFGAVLVTVDLAAGDCVVHAPKPDSLTGAIHRKRFNSLDEVQGAYQVQIGLAATDPIARDFSRALKFAGQQLRTREGCE